MLASHTVNTLEYLWSMHVPWLPMNEQELQELIDELETALEKFELKPEPETHEQAISRAAERLTLVRKLDELKQ